MATAVTIFEAALDAAIAEVDAENWIEARKKIVTAQMQFLKLPTEMRKGPESLRYRERMDSMLDILKTIDSLADSTKRSRDNRRLITTKMGF